MNTKEKIEVMQAYLDRKTIQIKGDENWSNVLFNREPVWQWHTTEYRIKPEPNIINLWQVIDSNVDCEFTTDDTWQVIGKLIKINKDYKYFKYKSMSLDKCRIRENHWHYHDGSSKRPIPEGLAVDVQYIRNRQVIQYLHAEPDWDRVTVYQVIHQKDGWVYPWEINHD